MTNRIKQFFRGLFAKPPDTEEQNIIKDLLSPEAQQAFYHMTKADQRHSLNVLATASSLADQNEIGGGMPLLQRCCLLHDIGRGPDMGVFRKSYAVLFDRFFHDWAVKYGSRTSSNPLREMLFRYYRHPEISCDMLRNMGMEQEGNIISRHHSGITNGLTPEDIYILDILIQADNLN